MRNLIVVVCILVASTLLLAAGPAQGRDATAGPAAPAALAADADAPALAGTVAEEREYLQREAASPEAQDFAGGTVVVFVGVGFVVVLFLCVFVIFAADHHIVHVH